MKKSELLKYLPFIIIFVFPFVLIALHWGQIPEKIPVHWNIRGEVDRYGNTWEIFILPVVNILVFLLILGLARIDPKKNYQKYSRTLLKIQLGVALLLLLIFILSFYAALGYKMAIMEYTSLGVSILFIVLGNYLSKIRPNYFVGIRTPWTLESEDVWKKTHRFGGRLMIGIGFLILIVFFILSKEWSFGLMIGCSAVLSIAMFLYSFLIYQKTDKNSVQSNS